ncbi:hypothetical protein [Cronobacter sakazakii]|uniref:hypothetical protein n=1 Tax=Cronobacter sakazakii TaxID=28141 RepID=UPI001F40AD12|nr:hypothetical protein [Cronobacter sakazakii]
MRDLILQLSKSSIYSTKPHQDINGVTWVNYRAAEEGPIKKIEVKTGKSVVQGIEVKGLEAGYIEVPLK